MSAAMKTQRARDRQLYGPGDPAEQPAYPLSEVAHFLWMPHGKLFRWAMGYTHDGVRESPLIKVADRANGLLSFNNLTELHVLSALRGHNVPLQRMRRALVKLRHRYEDHPHPLLAEELATDGYNVFGDLIGVPHDPDVMENLSDHGQLALRALFGAYLKRIDRDPSSGTILRLFPMVGPFKSSEDLAEQPKIISIDPRVAFGRPVLAGTRIPTVELASRFAAGENVESICDDLGIDARIVQTAIRYHLARQVAA